MNLFLKLHLTENLHIYCINHMQLTLRCHCDQSVSAVNFGNALAYDVLLSLEINFKTKLVISTL